MNAAGARIVWLLWLLGIGCLAGLALILIGLLITPVVALWLAWAAVICGLAVGL